MALSPSQAPSYNLNSGLGVERRSRRNSLGGDIAATQLASFTMRTNAQLEASGRHDGGPRTDDNLVADAAAGCLEEKLRLLDHHRRSALEHCERFLCDMEAAMATAEAAARACDSRHNATGSSGATPLPLPLARNASAKVNPLMAPASPSWLADVSYYGQTSRRSFSAASSGCASGASGASGASCLSSSGATQRRPDRRRRSWTAGCPETRPASDNLNSTMMVNTRNSNPWGAEDSTGGTV